MQQREILFRGKHWQSGKWVFGAHLPMMQDENGSLRRDAILETSIHFYSDRQPIDPDTLGQYTGLQDVNGAKIFEGDVLQSVNGIGYVVWDGTGFALKSPGSEAVDWHPSAYYKTMEIVGNIHDNPELINQ